jgi:hypothetical protein
VYSKALALFMLLAAVLAAAGCATIATGTTQAVVILTPGAPGATCTLTSTVVGSKVVTTPATITLDTSQENINVVCKKQYFQDGVGVIPARTEPMTAGNVLVGGVIGLGVVAVSGAMNRYNDNNQFTMVPIAGCQA